MPTDDYAGGTSTTGRVSVGGATTGSIESIADTDWFAVLLSANVVYQFDLEGLATSRGTLSDPFLRLYNSSGTVLATDDDSGTGTNAQITYRATSAGTYYLDAEPFSSYSTGTYRLSAASIADDYASTSATTGRVAVGGSTTGSIEVGGDSDWFAVTLSAGQRYGISITGTTLSDPWLRLYNSSGTELVSDRYNYSGTANLAYTATTAGTYYIAAAHSYDSAYYNYTGSYTVAVQGDDYRADTMTTGRVAVGGSTTGAIETNGDADWFAVSLTAGYA